MNLVETEANDSWKAQLYGRCSWLTYHQEFACLLSMLKALRNSCCIGGREEPRLGGRLEVRRMLSLDTKVSCSDLPLELRPRSVVVIRVSDICCNTTYSCSVSMVSSPWDDDGLWSS